MARDSGPDFRNAKAPTRIELVYGEEMRDQPYPPEPQKAIAPELPAELQRIVQRLTRRERDRAE